VPINLLLLSNLSVLYIRIPQPGIADSMALDTLSTITSSSRTRQITLSFRSPQESLRHNTFTQIDSALAGLPLNPPPAMELEMDGEEYDQWAPHFPQLNSQNMVCCRRFSPIRLPYPDAAA
jgi:hypothetical protein